MFMLHFFVPYTGTSVCIQILDEFTHLHELRQQKVSIPLRHCRQWPYIRAGKLHARRACPAGNSFDLF
jgi:hypothetical protein